MEREFQNLPIYNEIRKYHLSNPTPFHMPGHKLGQGFPDWFKLNLYKMDLTEIPGLDNLNCPNGVIEEAQQYAADVFGAKRTYFCVNGATCAIQAAIAAETKFGDKVLVERNCHKAVIEGLVLSGATPVYYKNSIDKDIGIPLTIDPEDFIAFINENKDAKVVVLTRPNYYGFCHDLESVVQVVKENNMILIVDEAHGSHFVFNSALPLSALELGADIVIQSAHKTLCALTQGAYLHIGGDNANIDSITFWLSLLQTTSPSYIIIASLDFARYILQVKGKEMIKRAIIQANNFKKKFNSIDGFRIIENHDPLRLVINVDKTGLSGFEIYKKLWENYAIYAEMADMYNVVFILPVWEDKQMLITLFNALKEISSEINEESRRIITLPEFSKLPELSILPREAIMSEKEEILLSEATDRISADIVTPYPPGVPCICPGETINNETIKYVYDIISLGGDIIGISKDFKIKVVKEND